MSDEYEPRGCPECSWGGEVAITSGYKHTNYTHIIVEGGEVFRGKTCVKETGPKVEWWYKLMSGVFNG